MSADEPSSVLTHTAVAMLVAVTSAALLLVVVGVLVVLARQRRKNSFEFQIPDVLLDTKVSAKTDSEAEVPLTNSSDRRYTLRRPAQTDVTEATYDDVMTHVVKAVALRKDEQVSVYLAQTDGHFSSATVNNRLVVLHVLAVGASEDARNRFTSHTFLLRQLQHTNIVDVITSGSACQPRPFRMVEYLRGGDLAQFLAQRQPGAKKGEGVLTVEEQVRICTQIGDAVAFLAQSQLVHRDVAVRNCQVGEGMRVKLADVSFARRVGVDGVYVGRKEEELPLRWLAPESLVSRVFSASSDVWSFGVFVWEVFSFGGQPYAGMMNEDVVQFVAQGGRLVAPPNAPALFENLFGDCFKSDPKERRSIQYLLSLFIADA